MPPMRAYRYSDKFAAGAIAAGGSLENMIPPSVPLVVYAVVAEQDIGELLLAGALPGILLVSLPMAAVTVSVRLTGLFVAVALMEVVCEAIAAQRAALVPPFIFPQIMAGRRLQTEILR